MAIYECHVLGLGLGLRLLAPPKTFGIAFPRPAKNNFGTDCMINFLEKGNRFLGWRNTYSSFH